MKKHLGIRLGKIAALLASVVLFTALAADSAGLAAADGSRPAGGLGSPARPMASASDGDAEGSRGGRQSGSPTNAGVAASQLPPEIELDRFLMKADQAVEDRDAHAARSAMDRIVALQEEHGMEPALEDHFRCAQAWQLAGEPQRALVAVTTYLQLLGRDAPRYREALRLLNEVEGGTSRPAADSSARSADSDPLGAAPMGPSGMEFVWIPAGKFRMGSTSSEAFDDEQPVTQVRISRGFWLGKYEVTQTEWEAVMGSNPSSFNGCGHCPVEEVSWNDVQDFTSRLNAQEGREVYRLPTEAEWEYAARAGTKGDRYGDLDAIAWYGDTSGRRTHPVGGKAPNAWGLHDVLGNVVEWVGDRYGDYIGGSVTDPQGPGSGPGRVIRGGCWVGAAKHSRTSNRNVSPPDVRYDFLGFRLARNAP